MWLAKMRLILVFFLLMLISEGTHCHNPDADFSLEYLLSKVSSSTPEQVKDDAEFDCAWRESAAKYAGEIQPWILQDARKSKYIYDALELGPKCGKAYSIPVVNRQTRKSPEADQENYVIKFYVDPLKGNDNQPMATMASGSISSPFKSIHSAVEATRAFRGKTQGGAAIFLRGGVYYLESTLQLKETNLNRTST